MPRIALCLLILLAPVVPLRAQTAQPPTIGINYYDCFVRTLADPADTSYVQGFEVLAQYEIPFARAAFCGYYSNQMRLYLDNRDEYFRRMDAVVAAAEIHGVKLIPSLFWWYPCVPDLVEEPCNRWGDPNSKTHAFMRRYVTDVVTRYLHSPAVLAWEFGNELNLAIDLPNAAQVRPPHPRHHGSPEKRGPEDDLTSEMMLTALGAFAETVRAVDPARPISTGHAMPRPSAFHQRTELSWAIDSRAQFIAELQTQTPASFDLMSIHLYPGERHQRFERGREATYLELITAAQEAALQAGKTLFIGEFGALPSNPPGMNIEQTKAEGLSMLSAIEACRVPLAALWVFDFEKQPGMNVRHDNARSFYLEALRDANRRLASPSPTPVPSDPPGAPHAK